MAEIVPPGLGFDPSWVACSQTLAAAAAAAIKARRQCFIPAEEGVLILHWQSGTCDELSVPSPPNGSCKNANAAQSKHGENFQCLALGCRLSFFHRSTSLIHLHVLLPILPVTIPSSANQWHGTDYSIPYLDSDSAPPWGIRQTTQPPKQLFRQVSFSLSLCSLCTFCSFQFFYFGSVPFRFVCPFQGAIEKEERA